VNGGFSLGSFLTDTLGWRFLLAFAVSVTLWARLTLDQNPQRVDVYPTEISVEARSLPPNLVVANELPPVKLRLAAPQESWKFFEPGSFRVWVDLSGARPGLVQADVFVETSDPQVRVLETTPSKLSVRVEELKTVTVPVQASLAGQVPFGFRAGEPRIEPPNVQVSGPTSAIERVNVAQVSIRLDEARSTIDRSLRPEPRGPGGVVAGVRVEPQNVTVTLPVEQIAGSKTVSVVPVVRGQPAAGYWQGPIAVEPVSVQIVGDPGLLDTVTVLNTAEVDVSGAQAEVVRTVPIARPQGIGMVREQNATVRVAILPLQGQQVRDVQVTLQNVPEGFTATVAPVSVSVALSGPQPTLLRIGPQDVAATVNLANQQPGNPELPVQLPLQVQVPEGLRVDRVLPEQVAVTFTPRAP
jgi:YbbR domain-containing protein